MGLKDAAKALMEEAGVPVVPGYHGDSQDPGLLAAEADKIGYPVLIKARAGGGGKGMRLVEDPADFAAALEGAQREGQASFGDPACLVEKFITQPRHVEIQVFADGHGNVVHLYERDCSLQRRHQKVIEEAPAPDMPPAVRAAMGRAAVEAARTIGYEGAGTIEFIADGSGALREDGFWFMEMNTRLQVEHPVTEAITGLDLVEMQLRVAAGEPLPVAQEDLAINGHAFEARLYAEDVPKGFLPATGRLDHLAFPDGAAFGPGPVQDRLRRATTADVISPHYDPMIAKVIVHGPTRKAALNRLATALAETRVMGVETNLEFLGALARHEGFAAGEVDTGLIARDLDALTVAKDTPDHAVALAGLLALDVLQPTDPSDPWTALRGWRHWSTACQPVELLKGDSLISLQVEFRDEFSFTVEGPAGALDIDVTPNGGDAYALTLGPRRTTCHAHRTGNRTAVFADGAIHRFTVPDPLANSAEQAASDDTILAPMSGLVRVVSTKAGDRVSQGETLIVMEAMKMEHTLRAPRDGLVAEVLTQAGAQVEEATLLLSLEAEAEPEDA